MHSSNEHNIDIWKQTTQDICRTAWPVRLSRPGGVVLWPARDRIVWPLAATRGRVALRLAPRAMEADRGMIRKLAPTDVTLRSGGEGNATPARIAAPNVMACNAPLATDVWMRKRRKLLTLRKWKLFLKRDLLALRRRKKIIKKIMMLKCKTEIRWEVWWLTRDVCLCGLRWKELQGEWFFGRQQRLTTSAF